jgi:hypothetical protein
MTIRQRVGLFLADLQQTLFPALAAVVPEPVTHEHQRLIRILALVQVERVIPAPQTTPRGGRPPLDRRKLARAYLAKAALGMSETEDFHLRLQTDRTLRRLCGWEESHGVPSLSTFSRAFAEFAETRVLDRRHAELVATHLGDSITEHVGYDTTAIAVRERVAKPKADDTVPPAAPTVPRKRGRRPRGAEPPPPPEPTRLQRQQTQPVAEMLAELPTTCAVGCKQNSQGNRDYWIGYKFHVAQTDDGIPVAAFTTSANLHDSQGAIPLLHLTHGRVRSCYDLLDSAYDAKEIRAESQACGHVPIIDANARRTGTKAERERLARLPRSRLTVERALVEVDRRRRFGARTAVERFNSRLKDDCGARLIRVRGGEKVHAFLMCGLLVIFADALLALGGG